MNLSKIFKIYNHHKNYLIPHSLLLENLNTYLFLQKELKNSNQVLALKRSKPYNNMHIK